MGSVAQAVLEFDEAVQVPWRPPLAAAPALRVVPGGAVAGPGGRAHADRAGRLAQRPAPGSPPAVRRPAGAGAVCARCAGGACRPRSLRLTRRAHRLLAALLAAAAVAVAGWVGALAQDDDGLRLAGGVSTVVQPGDTLWSIARSVAGEADVRDVVDEIQRLNDLEGTTLVPGQVLELP